MSRKIKEILKDVVFTTFPCFLGSFTPYRKWKDALIFKSSIFESGLPKAAKKYPDVSGKDNLKSEYLPAGKSIKRVAIVVHVYNIDAFEEIIKYLNKCSTIELKLFITSPPTLSDSINEILKIKSFNYHHMPLDNKGRDILPFLKISAIAIKEGYELILKIHTKKSSHLAGGKKWRQDMLNKLITDFAMSNIVELFNCHQDIGMVGPAGHILPMSLYYGENAKKVFDLGKQMGARPEQFKYLHFVAGSMFYVRSQALMPLLNLELSDNQFETEAGQVDGTLAHAIERAFPLSIKIAGFYMADSSSSPNNISLNSTNNYRFIEKS